jgi:hypothetical protein
VVVADKRPRVACLKVTAAETAAKRAQTEQQSQRVHSYELLGLLYNAMLSSNAPAARRGGGQGRVSGDAGEGSGSVQ